MHAIWAALFGLLLGRYTWFVAEGYARLLAPNDNVDTAHATTATPPDARLLGRALRYALRHVVTCAPADRGHAHWAYLPAAVLAVVYVLLSAVPIHASTFALAWAVALLMLLAFIDARTQLLPDALTLPLLWTGLAAAHMGLGQVPLADALAATMIAYAALWLLAWLFLHLRGRDGMGGGDIKLLAAIGAWVGWPDVFLVLLCASVTGLCYAFVVARRHHLHGQHPFGPHLAGATIVLLMLRVIGMG